MLPRDEKRDRLTVIPQKIAHPTKDRRFSRHNVPNRRNETVSRIKGSVDGLEALEQWIGHVFDTERFKYHIYPDWYGIELEQYLKRPYTYFLGTIEKTIKNALLVSRRIRNIKINEIKQIGKSDASVTFTVCSIFGNLHLTKEISLKAVAQ